MQKAEGRAEGRGQRDEDAEGRGQSIRQRAEQKAEGRGRRMQKAEGRADGRGQREEDACRGPVAPPRQRAHAA